MATPTAPARMPAVNVVGLAKADYRGLDSTLCAGCGHDSISSQIISPCSELVVRPQSVIKLTGIGWSRKDPAYFMNRSFGLNALPGRIPSIHTAGLNLN